MFKDPDHRDGDGKANSRLSSGFSQVGPGLELEAASLRLRGIEGTKDGVCWRFTIPSCPPTLVWQSSVLAFLPKKVCVYVHKTLESTHGLYIQ